MPNPSFQAKKLKKKEWEHQLSQANGLDQVKSVIISWYTDEQALGPSPKTTSIGQCLSNAISIGDIPVIKFLVENGTILSPSVGLRTIQDSPKEKRFEIMDLLYHHGWDLNQLIFLCNPILSLCSTTDTDEEATRWMLDHGADPNPNVSVNAAPLTYAAMSGSINTIKLLLERGADPRRSVALRHAVERRRDWKESMELLLDYGADINAFHPYGYIEFGGFYPGSVLHVAAVRELGDRIPFLIERGADVCKKSENGFTPAELALYYKFKEFAYNLYYIPIEEESDDNDDDEV